MNRDSSLAAPMTEAYAVCGGTELKATYLL